jgi:catechol 2,3-dioxygenase-like lactoylglutathione lyase family enzyme
MAITPKTPGIHHIGPRSTDFDVTKNFYRDLIGFPLIVDTSDLIIFACGSVFIAFKKADPRDKEYSSFSPFEVGLDHVAIVKLDTSLNKLYIAFKDPDRIQWEF